MSSQNKKHIEECIRDNLESYFKDLRGVEPSAMYDMILRVVEKPLLDVVMKQADGNQSRAAEWLGINRNTLRRKLVEHKLVK
jgi:Fis family transcriptional regulator, factor for inversion stimulation protein